MTPEIVSRSAAANKHKDHITTPKKSHGPCWLFDACIFGVPSVWASCPNALKETCTRSNSVHGRIQYQPSICHATAEELRRHSGEALNKPKLIGYGQNGSKWINLAVELDVDIIMYYVK